MLEKTWLCFGEVRSDYRSCRKDVPCSCISAFLVSEGSRQWESCLFLFKSQSYKQWRPLLLLLFAVHIQEQKLSPLISELCWCFQNKVKGIKATWGGIWIILLKVLHGIRKWRLQRLLWAIPWCCIIVSKGLHSKCWLLNAFSSSELTSSPCLLCFHKCSAPSSGLGFWHAGCYSTAQCLSCLFGILCRCEFTCINN